jgi:hypothetical protein
MTAYKALVAVGVLAMANWGWGLRAAANTPQNGTTNLVTVRGCLHGQEITTVDETGTNGAAPQRFRITDDRETLSELKKHSGHFEEVTGTLTSGTADGGLRVGEKRIPKGRIYVGAGRQPFERPGTASDPAALSTLALRDFKHLASRCGT